MPGGRATGQRGAGRERLSRRRADTGERSQHRRRHTAQEYQDGEDYPLMAAVGGSPAAWNNARGQNRLAVASLYRSCTLGFQLQD
jgi:hypothetical protein